MDFSNTELFILGLITGLIIIRLIDWRVKRLEYKLTPILSDVNGSIKNIIAASDYMMGSIDVINKRITLVENYLNTEVETYIRDTVRKDDNSNVDG